MKTKYLYIILMVLFFFLGIIVGILLGLFIANHPAYPWVWDWNGDGQILSNDAIAMFDEYINGPKYPEFILGPDVPLD